MFCAAQKDGISAMSEVNVHLQIAVCLQSLQEWSFWEWICSAASTVCVFCLGYMEWPRMYYLSGLEIIKVCFKLQNMWSREKSLCCPSGQYMGSHQQPMYADLHSCTCWDICSGAVLLVLWVSCDKVCFPVFLVLTGFCWGLWELAAWIWHLIHGGALVK